MWVCVSPQISHHPPVSAFYVTNRQDGFAINGSILAKSKFYGNSVSAIMDGVGRLTLLKRGEDYTITMPYAHCKGASTCLLCALALCCWKSACMARPMTRRSPHFSFHVKLAALFVNDGASFCTSGANCSDFVRVLSKISMASPKQWIQKVLCR